MLTYQSDSPWGTFLWLRFADDYTPTRPGYTAQMPPTVFYDSAALSGLQVCFKTLMAVHLENGLQRFLCFYLRLLIQNTGSEKLLYSKLMVE